MSSSAWLLIIAIVLIFIASYLIAVETALGKVSRKGHSPALLDILDDRPRYVNVLHFLAVTATVTATIFVALAFEGIFTASSAWAPVVLAVVVMVVVSYIVLGVAPRTLGRQHADAIASGSARLVRGLTRVLSPLATALIAIGNAITPGKGYREGPFATQAELRELVDMAEADQVIEDDERQMIHSVFELSETIAREVMVPRTEMVTIDRDKTLRQALSLCLRSGFSRIPVQGTSADDIIGVVYLKDISRRLYARGDHADGELVESLMRPAHFVPDSKNADDLLREMQTQRVHLVIAVDEYGGTAGLVTIEDILEEIVGEIVDEYDTELPEVERLDDGRYRVLARMHVEDVAELIGTEIDGEEEGVDTVLGLMAKRLGRVPIVGASIDVDGWTLTAEQAAGRRNRIGAILLSPNTEAS